MVRGESVEVLVDYDLFDNNINGNVGIFLKTDTFSGKHLIYFPDFSEWAELKSDQIRRRKPGFVPKKNREFIDRVKTLGS